ncbi:hypothetical protein GIB67_025512 [Kingdonia uniflora]|uniref:Uncharacterized protein n=1 Tax=Kingdonia uniflora TaxID=39325 RepID=A0A7J7PCK1_9MAGN|nr:hypothetical protein GIB67_025512 [Kingdonia uniflora]
MHNTIIPMFTGEFFIFFFFLVLHSHSETAAAASDDEDTKHVAIGAKIDKKTCMGKEEKIALEIAIQDFNTISSDNHKFVLNLRDWGGDPLQAASSGTVSVLRPTRFIQRKIIVIYEDDAYGGSSKVLTVLSDALQDIGSEIEYWSVSPPFSSLSNLEFTIREEIERMKSRQSRVFIVLRASSEFAFKLVAEANKWI